MKKAIKIVITVLFVITLITTAFCLSKMNLTDNTIIHMLNCYAKDPDNSGATIEADLKKLSVKDDELAQNWRKIMNYWHQVNKEDFVTLNVAKDGLADDNSMCIVVLGFELNEDGSMKPELIGRLQTAYDTAVKYPNAYVACTGGGTAKNNPDATEADQMAQWLLDKGLAKERLIVENKSMSTVENAQNTYKILNENYPSVNKICMVTSDYHVPRGCLTYYAQLVLSASESKGKEVDIVANTGYQTNEKGYESVDLQAYCLQDVAGIMLNWKKLSIICGCAAFITGTVAYILKRKF